MIFKLGKPDISKWRVVERGRKKACHVGFLGTSEHWRRRKAFLEVGLSFVQDRSASCSRSGILFYVMRGNRKKRGMRHVPLVDLPILMDAAEASRELLDGLKAEVLGVRPAKERVTISHLI
jgi:hypothetical protein